VSAVTIGTQAATHAAKAGPSQLRQDHYGPAGARRRARQVLSAVRDRFGPTTAGRVWRRLCELGFISSSLQFAAVFALGFIPFLMLISAALGPALTRAIVTRSGFSTEAAHDLAVLFSHARPAPASLTVLALVLAVLGGGTVAHMVQDWYAKTFRTPVRGWKAIARRAQWLAGVFGFLALQAVIGRWLQPHGGDIAAAGQFLLTLVFWWWSLHTLLAGQVSWRRLFPAGLATATCYTGLIGYIAGVMSSSIVADDASYGPIGAVITLLTAEIGLGVVLQLGAAIGATIGHGKDPRPPPGRSQTPAGSGKDIMALPSPPGGLAPHLSDRPATPEDTCRKCGKSIIKPARPLGPGTSPERGPWMTNDSDGDAICTAPPGSMPHEPQNSAERD
jgi:membrane protein